MLKKQNRLTSRFEYNKVRFIAKKNKQRVTSKYFVLYYLRNSAQNEKDESKFGIVVPNNLTKSAPQRNRVKRIFREIIRTNFDKINNGYWVVIYPSKSVLEASYEEISIELIKVLQKIHVAR